MKRLLPLVLLSVSAAAAQPAREPYCKRVPFDEQVPAGLVGKYAVVGREADTGKTYSGVLEIAVVKGTYALTRTVHGQKLKGEAWVESCSPDKFRVLRATYESKPKAIELSCYLRFDGDNYTRASCTTFDGGGLEAWYQSHAP
jgi:hypothetical protein